MAYGMSYDEYWHGDIYLPLTYIRAHRERMKIENELAYLHGAYQFEAIGRALSNAFAEKGTRPIPYLDKPFPLYGESEERDDYDEDHEEEVKRAMARMQNLVMIGKNMESNKPQ